MKMVNCFGNLLQSQKFEKKVNMIIGIMCAIFMGNFSISEKSNCIYDIYVKKRSIIYLA